MDNKPKPTYPVTLNRNNTKRKKRLKNESPADSSARYFFFIEVFFKASTSHVQNHLIPLPTHSHTPHLPLATMPPRGITKVVRAAKKRKNVDRSDDETDSDFDYTHYSKQRSTSSKQKPRQERQELSSKVQVVRSIHKQKQHAVPSLSASDSPSPPADSWRAELSEMVRHFL